MAMVRRRSRPGNRSELFNLVGIFIIGFFHRGKYGSLAKRG
jgi:hypothetical protein